MTWKLPDAFTELILGQSTQGDLEGAEETDETADPEKKEPDNVLD